MHYNVGTHTLVMRLIKSLSPSSSNSSSSQEPKQGDDNIMVTNCISQNARVRGTYLQACFIM